MRCEDLTFASGFSPSGSKLGPAITGVATCGLSERSTSLYLKVNDVSLPVWHFPAEGDLPSSVAFLLLRNSSIPETLLTSVNVGEKNAGGFKE